MAPRRSPSARALVLPAALLVAWLGGCERVESFRGSLLYDRHCVVCHGPGGRGQNPARPYGSIAPEVEGWIAPALDGRGHCFLHTRSEITAIVRDGSPFPGTPMVGYKGRLTDEEIGRIVTYLISLWERNTRREYERRETELERLRRGAG